MQSLVFEFPTAHLGIYLTLYHVAFNRIETFSVGFCHHNFRHYAASIMHAIGAPDLYVMQRGGWSSDKTLKAIYRGRLMNTPRSIMTFQWNATQNAARIKGPGKYLTLNMRETGLEPVRSQ